MSKLIAKLHPTYDSYMNRVNIYHTPPFPPALREKEGRNPTVGFWVESETFKPKKEGMI
jgi:hypothetical protein